jgi:hypothetical protein
MADPNLQTCRGPEPLAGRVSIVYRVTSLLVVAQSLHFPSRCRVR